MRTTRPQTIETRSPRLADRIVGGFFAPAPPVKNDQHDRTALLHLPQVLCTSPALAKRANRHSSPPRRVVWDRDAIVNQRLVCGRSRPCLRCHTEAIFTALKSFARAVCGLPEVCCVTYAKLADFLDQQNSETLAAYRRGDFAHVATPTLKVAQRSR